MKSASEPETRDNTLRVHPFCPTASETKIRAITAMGSWEDNNEKARSTGSNNKTVVTRKMRR